MQFKRCSKCGEIIIESNIKCPFCGNDTFTEISEKDTKCTGNESLSKTETSGSIWLGILLGSLLGFIGFIIACISNGKENGKTIIGTAIGVGIQCLVALIIILGLI